MILLRPDLFITTEDITTVPNISEQKLPSSAVRLVDIICVKSGNALEEVGVEQFNRSYPKWTSDAAGTPTKYLRNPRNPTAYMLYPRPVAGTVLVGEYVKTPPTYTLSDNIEVLPDAYYTSLVDGTVYLAQSVDNEHVNSGRAKMFYESFIQTLVTSLQSRGLIDIEPTKQSIRQGQQNDTQ
jgi:hypothetical protein